MYVAFRLGKVPADQRSGEIASVAGPRRIFAQLRRDHGRKEERHQGSADDEVSAGNGAGDRPRLQRLRLAWTIDGTARVLRDADETQRLLRCGGKARVPAARQRA